MTVPVLANDHSQLTCLACHHDIQPYGFHAWRCAQRCRCVLMLGCIPTPTPSTPEALPGLTTPQDRPHVS